MKEATSLKKEEQKTFFLSFSLTNKISESSGKVMCLWELLLFLKSKKQPPLDDNHC